MLTALFDEVEDERITPDFVAEVSEEITKNRRFPQSGGLDEQQDHPRPHFAGHRRSVLSIRKERGLKLSFDLIDKVIDNVKTVALRRF